VIHACWRVGRGLALWAEDSAGPLTGATRGEHPFAASAEQLRDELKSDLPAAAATMTLALPGWAATPADSPELLRDEIPDRPRGSVALRPWQVPCLEYDADDAFAVLAELDPDRLTLGATPRHLVELAAFAGDLVARGRVLPTISSAESARALWRPVLTGPDVLWAQSLALAMPPAARAGASTASAPAAAGASAPASGASAPGSGPASEGPTSAGPASAGQVTADALDTLVDAAARMALAAAGVSPRRVAPASPALAFVAALTGTVRTIAAGPEQLRPLAEELAAWQRDAAGGRVRACFRLVEPVGEDDATDAWRLDFALQAADEPSLVVDAERVWKSKGALRALARHLEDPQETLLTELGRATRLYPALEAALRTAKPSTMDIDATGAHDFLREGAPVLATAGFGVLLPSWWSRPKARLGARLTARSHTAPGTVAGTSKLGLNSIVEYEWELALGDEKLTAAELKALTKLKAPLVRLRGQWVELDAKRLQSALKLIASRGEMSVADLLHAGLATDAGPAGLPVVSVTAEGPLGELLSGQAERRLAPVPTPDGFRGVLRPYQERGLAWLSFLESLGLGGILADDMGLGKTVQLLALFLRERAEAGREQPTLLICPMSLVGNWQREAEKFAPLLRVHTHHGAERPRGKAFDAAVSGADLVITTYALAARDAADLSTVEWHRVVVDEAQAIKNAATRQAAAVRALPARNRIAVTGTPVENRLADLWSIMEFANPGLLGSALAFKARYAEPVEKRGDEVAAERLRRLTGPFVLRRLKSDKTIIADLPEKLEMEVVCNLTAEQASLYQAVVTDMMGKIEASEGIERRGLVLATMTKLKQVCNHPAQLLRDGTRLAGRSGKLSRLEEILDEVLAVGEKALLFTQYAEFGAMLHAHLSARFGREVAFLHGGVAKPARDAMVQRFQSSEPGSPLLFVLSLKAGGTGLTLTAANHVVHVDRWWNPAVEDQATDRAYRIGQRRSVQVRKFVCAGTVEEKISAMIRDKRGLAARIVGTGEQWLTELSTSELRDLFALEAGAVVE
jgi:non-specific serine/threonine protein kinase